jgi:hypothetical protein
MREESSEHGVSKKTFSNQEKRSYCIAWEKSGVSKRVFCKAEGFAPSTFFAWYSLFKKQRLEEPSFSPVVVKSSISIKRQDMIQFEMRLPNQAQLFITMREHGLVSFIQELCHAVTVIR